MFTGEQREICIDMPRRASQSPTVARRVQDQPSMPAVADASELEQFRGFLRKRRSKVTASAEAATAELQAIGILDASGQLAPGYRTRRTDVSGKR